MTSKEDYIQDAQQFAEANDISPLQLKKILKSEEDLDFLRTAILEAKKDPDVKYLIAKYSLDNPPKRSTAGKMFGSSLVHAVSIGDSIGSMYEFQRHAPVNNLLWHFGNETDDSHLARAIKDAVNEYPDNPAFRRFLLKAYRENPDLDYGGGFIRWAQGRSKHFWEQKIPDGVFDNSKGYHSTGNGCLPRMAYIPAYYYDYDTAVRVAVSSCMATHNNTESVKAVILWTNCLWLASSASANPDIDIKQQIYDMIRSSYADPNNMACARKFDFEHSCEPKTEQSDDSLYAGYALCMVVSHFYCTKNVTNALIEILKSFCDADTLCAMECTLWKAFDGTDPMCREEVYG